MRLFGSARSPQVRVGRPSNIIPVMLDALCDHLAEKPDLYVEEMAVFLWDEFGVLPSLSSIKRALSCAGWTRKKAQQKAKEQSPELRDFYQHKLSKFRSYHLVFHTLADYFPNPTLKHANLILVFPSNRCWTVLYSLVMINESLLYYRNFL